MARAETPSGGGFILAAAFVAVGALRAFLSAQPPAETTDVLRNVAYGAAFAEHGFGVYDITAMTLAGGAEWRGLWPDHTFDYPAATLLFFAALAKVSTSLVFAKAVLTAVELASALLVRRMTGSWTLALAWFASPASLWWVSSEGQFEGVGSLLTLAALHALDRRRDGLAFGALALAIQTKIVPVVLLPYFLARSRSAKGLAGFAAGFAPSALALARGSYLGRMAAEGYWAHGFNPFAWDVLEPEHFAWMPRWLVVACAAQSVALLGLALAALARHAARRELVPALGALGLVAFLVALKSAGWAQFWYVLLVPPLALSLGEGRVRAAIVGVAIFEPRAVSALVVGPVGNVQWFRIQDFLHGLP